MRRLTTLALAFALLVAGYVAGSRQLLTPAYVMASEDCALFQQTGKQVCGRFLQYWQQNGGLAQQGLPLTNVFPERSSVNGQTYQVQYFERAIFELHPENAPPYDVLLTLLGREKLQAQYGGRDPSAGPPPSAQPTPQPSSPPNTGYPRTASTNQVQLTVHQVRDRVPPSFTQPDPGNRFVGIDVTLRNVGGKTFSSNKLYFRLRGSDGRDYQVVYVGVPEPQVSLRDIPPSDDTRGWITFELPEGLQLVRLTFDHILLDGPVSVPLGP
jgi:hypothetical protein